MKKMSIFVLGILLLSGLPGCKCKDDKKPKKQKTIQTKKYQAILSIKMKYSKDKNHN